MKHWQRTLLGAKQGTRRARQLLNINHHNRRVPLMNTHPPIRVQPVGKIRSRGELIVLGRLPSNSDEEPQATFYGQHGHADVYEDRIQLFIPALLAAAAPMLKSAVPALMSAGKAAIGKAAAAMAGTELEEETGAAEEEEDAEDEEQDAIQQDGSDCSCKKADRRGRRRRRRSMPTPEAVETMQPMPPHQLKSQPTGEAVGMTYQEDSGTIEFFFPALAGLVPAIGGLFSRLLGGKKKKKKKKAKGSRRSMGRRPPPVVQEEPGEGEPPEVSAAIAAAIKRKKSEANVAPAAEKNTTVDPIPYDKAAGERALNTLTNLRVKRITENAMRSVRGEEPLIVPDNPLTAEDPLLAALDILQRYRIQLITQNAMGLARGEPPVEVPPDPLVAPASEATKVTIMPPTKSSAPEPTPTEEESGDEDQFQEEEGDAEDNFDAFEPDQDGVYDVEEDSDDGP